MDRNAAYLRRITDDQGCIAGDLVCRRCAYNLRGLPGGGRCPECGLPVGRSAWGDMLRYSDPAWVEKLQHGLLLALCGLLCRVAVALMARLAATGADAPVLMALLDLGATMVGYYGVWRLTTRDPSGIGEDQYGRTRRFIRFALVVALVLDIGAAMTTVMVALPVALLAGPPIAVILTTLLDVAALLATLSYLEKLARRVPDDDLADRAQVLLWALVVLLVTGVIGVLLIAFTQSGAVDGAGIVAGVLAAASCAGVFLLLLFAGMLLALLLQLQQCLREQAELARATWAADIDDEF